MKLSHAITVLAAFCAIHQASAADDHKGHAHDEKPGQAHAHDVKPQHGGIVSVVKDINYELVAKADALTLYVTDHDQPVDTKNASATMTLLSASGLLASVDRIWRGATSCRRKGPSRSSPA